MIKVYKTGFDFLADNENKLMQDEIKNNLILGISKKDIFNDSFYISSIIEDEYLLGVIAGANMIISANTLNEVIYKEFIEYMKDINYPGIIGEKSVCYAYNEMLNKLTNKKLVIKTNQRIYYCDKVLTNHHMDTSVRLATENDFEILKQWLYDFYKDIEESVSIDKASDSLKRLLKQKCLYVLEKDQELLSMAAIKRPLNASATVGEVFTPKTHRNKGYASKIVEKLTNIIISQNKVATLYTDLANPTSNSIYQKIGYKPYCDAVCMVEKVREGKI